VLDIFFPSNDASGDDARRRCQETMLEKTIRRPRLAANRVTGCYPRLSPRTERQDGRNPHHPPIDPEACRQRHAGDGATPGGNRRIGLVAGGTFEGPKLRGTVLPGGADWIIVRPDGATTLDVRIMSGIGTGSRPPEGPVYDIFEVL